MGKEAVIFCGIPGMGKDTLITQLCEKDKETTQFWSHSNQIPAPTVVISQDQFIQKREYDQDDRKRAGALCLEAFENCMYNGIVERVYLSRNNFCPNDRRPYLDIAAKVGCHVVFVFPDNHKLLSGNALFVICLRNILQRENHPSGLDKEMDPCLAAYICYSFLHNMKMPSRSEYSGGNCELVPYRMFQKPLNAGQEKLIREIMVQYKISHLPAFRMDSPNYWLSLRPWVEFVQSPTFEKHFKSVLTPVSHVVCEIGKKLDAWSESVAAEMMNRIVEETLRDATENEEDDDGWHYV